MLRKAHLLVPLLLVLLASSSQALYSPSPGNGKKVAWSDSYLGTNNTK